MGRIALLSTSNKQGLVELATALVQEFGFTLLSSGGTAKTLQAAGIPVTTVSEYTGAPEILGGRVKTLHPKIHGGILARRDRPADQAELQAQGINPIDLVVVNLYPFAETIAQPNVSLAEAIEQIDIGGPTLIRAAAKNHAHVTVLVDPSQYETYLQELRLHGEAQPAFRLACAQRAFTLTASYDQAIAEYLQEVRSPGTEPDILPPVFHLMGQQKQVLRYGENPHQRAAWYISGAHPSGWAAADLLQGKELSYNNLLDLEAARAVISEFLGESAPAAVIIKHTNPCGVAEGKTLVEAYERAFAADSVSAFGGIVALNRPLDVATAEALSRTFLECVVAPACEEAALPILKTKPKMRVLTLPELQTAPTTAIQTIAGGFLVQDIHPVPIDPEAWQVVTATEPSPELMAELIFAWKVVKHVKSNAIVVSRDLQTQGIGAGQMNRVGAVQIALSDAGEAARGGVLASDGFFPFADSVQAAALAGIAAIIQPGGSLRDNESIQAANEAGIAMVFTNRRHFRH
ncbi:MULTISPECIES: bifunctional phosphoribosylaminoimidazolecarboxamide formyltransferase/IMP cyclohydrolase [unclassified Thermosynechococcus]|uniref:bifunctional phosphoribosylaminoimidazolecarboxamide formyltransferase/IMP cyclohydrolase n=1 Tax=unclassified Thermosynechococcus TaxID=2622553 RepID=UPI0019F0AF57|nr:MULTISPECIES: bifunctional phosphoribosylaminoimidazolecarboxamide formyltransferase/IMP cyclohydrolase [unclassified Thermosynechococcus]HIK35374.1 bifunctional phosphoribosylaminoimidazolecarboxamide formyltransferase/IMP cyclohydrolase [Thermosynechococcus sp. M98_K2018_005]HIK47788.1 bifunctional phosphoribosylaminoimidazolecarboxamide formyltransferase/IMP cyclohydrolase [Thermosynechococcus sp. M55_K2018_012]